MYFPSPAIQPTIEQIEPGWKVVRQITDLPPMGVPVLLRVQDRSGKAAMDTWLIQYYIGFVSRLVYGMKETPNEPGHFEAVAVPEFFIETPAGPVCAPDLAVQGWTFIEDKDHDCPPWRIYLNKEEFPYLGYPIIIQEYPMLKTQDYFYKRELIAYPIQVIHGYVRIQDEQHAFDVEDDTEEQYRVLLSVPQPNGAEPLLLYRSIVRWRPLPFIDLY